jgi:methylenetetrahydrofolate reductase (NADPH)
MDSSGSGVPPPPAPPPSFLDSGRFSVLCEIQPPRRPDIEIVRDQIHVLNPVVDAFLIPDNHLGRATVSSVSVAHEVAYMGGLSIACMNARDRNVLGFRRDLLTAAAYGVDHFLFVYGDAPKEGRRTEDLTVRGMIDEVRSFGTGPLFQGYPDFRIGTVVRSGRDLLWRARADFIFVQITYATSRLLEWRASLDYGGRMYAGVLVLSSSRMAQRVNAALPDVHIPRRIVDKLDDDPEMGIEIACDQIEELRESGAFDGVHLIPVGRYREVAQRLAERGGSLC